METEKKEHKYLPVLITVLVMLLVAAGAVAGVWYYMDQQAKKTAGDNATQVASLQKQIDDLQKESTNSLQSYERGRPQIVGNSDCIAKTNTALDLVESKAPDSYLIITNYIGIIQCTDSGSGMYPWESPPKYLVGAATMNAGTMWYAGTIVHDSGHSKLYHDYFVNNPDATSVPSEIYSGGEAEQKCLELQYTALQQMGADQATLDYVKNVINTEYWNNPVRWW